MTFPAGEIEPDPGVFEGAAESLSRWTDSAGVFLRFVPQAVIVPAVVRNVVWKGLALNPLLRVQRERVARERLAAALQLLSHMVLNTRPVDVTVQFGPPIRVSDGGFASVAASPPLDQIHAQVIEGMRNLLDARPEGEGAQVV